MKRVIDNFAVGLIGLVLVLAMAFLFVPLLLVVTMSLDSRDYFGQFPPPSVSLQWYERFFGDSNFMEGFKTSLLLALCTAVISTGLGTATAVFLDRHRFPGREALTALFLSPIIVPTVVMGFGLLLFISALGFYNGFLRLLAGHVIVTLPYVIRTALASLAGVRRSLVDAALSLGATDRQAFWDIVFPLAKPGIFAGFVFAFSLSLDEVTLSVFLVDAYSFTLPVALLASMRDNFNLTIAAASVVLIGITVAVLLLLDRFVGIETVIGTRIYRV
jgi:putative spermidine/putrescine transport system permease protein